MKNWSRGGMRGAVMVLTATFTTAVAGCSRAPAPSGGPAPSHEGAAHRVAPPMPAIPLVDSALAIRVVYPPQDSRLPARTASDSNFIFGSVGSGRATLTINGAPVQVAPNGAFLAWLPLPPGGPGDTLRWQLVATRGTETARLEQRVRINPRSTVAARPPAPTPTAPATRDSAALADSLCRARPGDAGCPAVFVRLGGALAPADTDRVIVGRPTPAGTYRWFFVPGTAARLTGRANGFARVRLDSALDVWVDSADAVVAPDVNAVSRRTTGNVRLRADTVNGWTDITIAASAPMPYFVEERDDALVLTLYDTRANTDQVSYGPTDRVVHTVEWEQVADDRAQYRVNLRRDPFGYMVFWRPGALVLRVRETPAVDARHPLRGLTIAVDPGHPPAGATGPTGLWEPQAALWVGERLRDMLTAAGATVFMTRTTMDPVGLGDRPVMARERNADAFVSIHLNALPDGANPFAPRGSGTYFYRTHSEPLAREIQRGLVENVGLLDEGVYAANFAVVRHPWMPAVLTEGLYLMHPQQEYFLRTKEGQERYARAILEGLTRYFAGLARED